MSILGSLGSRIKNTAINGAKNLGHDILREHLGAAAGFVPRASRNPASKPGDGPADKPLDTSSDGAYGGRAAPVYTGKSGSADRADQEASGAIRVMGDRVTGAIENINTELRKLSKKAAPTGLTASEPIQSKIAKGGSGRTGGLPIPTRPPRMRGKSAKERREERKRRSKEKAEERRKRAEERKARREDTKRGTPEEKVPAKEKSPSFRDRVAKMGKTTSGVGDTILKPLRTVGKIFDVYQAYEMGKDFVEGTGRAEEEYGNDGLYAKTEAGSNEAIAGVLNMVPGVVNTVGDWIGHNPNLPYVDPKHIADIDKNFTNSLLGSWSPFADKGAKNRARQLGGVIEAKKIIFEANRTITFKARSFEGLPGAGYGGDGYGVDGSDGDGQGGGSGSGGGRGRGGRGYVSPPSIRYNRQHSSRVVGGGGRSGGHGGQGGRQSVTANRNLTPEARALLDTIAGTESPDYNTEYGGTKFSSYKDHPREGHIIQSGPNKGKTSAAAGRYQFLPSTWDDIAHRYGIKDFTPENQDQGAWILAQEEYARRTGRNLGDDLKSKDPAVIAGIGRALRHQWTSLPGGIEAGTNDDKFSRAYAQNRTMEDQKYPHKDADDKSGSAPGGNASYGGKHADLVDSPGRHPDTENVDPRLKDIIGAAQAHLPPGYRVTVNEGYNTQGHVALSQHHIKGKGALDVQIVDPDGRVLPNEGGDPTGMYHRLAQAAYGEMKTRYPELDHQFAWGGSFGASRTNSKQDLMHFDIGGERGGYTDNYMSKMGPLQDFYHKDAPAVADANNSSPVVPKPIQVEHTLKGYGMPSGGNGPSVKDIMARGGTDDAPSYNLFDGDQSKWKVGPGAETGRLQPGTPIGMFNDRGGFNGSQAIFRDYIRDENGNNIGIKADKVGSKDEESEEYYFGKGKEGSSFRAIKGADGKYIGGDHNPMNGNVAGAASDAPSVDAPGRVVDRANSLDGADDKKTAKALGKKMTFGEWCADFVNGVLSKEGIKGTGSAASDSFKKWGVHVEKNDVKKGDIIVESGKLSTGEQLGHVGIANGKVQTDEHGNIVRYGMVSGNHDDHVVKDYWEDTNRVTELRRASAKELGPADAPKEAENLPPREKRENASKVDSKKKIHYENNKKKRDHDDSYDKQQGTSSMKVSDNGRRKFDDSLGVSNREFA